MSVAVESVEGLYPFVLTEDQEALRKEIRQFAAREIAPHVSEWDEKSEFPAAVVKKLGAMGLLGVIFPPEYGGAGMGYVDYVLAIEELSAVDGSVGIIVAAHNSLGTNHIFLAGNEAQKRRYVPKLASGEWLGAWGLTEPGSGSDAGGARTTARLPRQPAASQPRSGCRAWFVRLRALRRACVPNARCRDRQSSS